MFMFRQAVYARSSPAVPIIENREGVNSFYEFGGYLPLRICVNRKSITETMAFRWLDIAGDNEKLASYLD